MFEYPVVLTPDDGGFHVTAPDFPEFHTDGDDETEALANARMALAAVLAVYVADRRDIPAPSPAEGRPVVAPPLHFAAKTLVYALMRAQGVSQVELAARMGVNPKQVQRLLDLTHGSPIEQIDKALDALEARPVLTMQAA
jgi:antitoxin HicB